MNMDKQTWLSLKKSQRQNFQLAQKVLCDIDRFDDLESIDRKQFFKFE